MTRVMLRRIRYACILAAVVASLSMAVVLEPAPACAAEKAGAPASTSERSASYEYELDEIGQATITGYFGDEDNLVIPGEVDGHSVVAIGSYAFEGNASLVSVDIPDSVTEIGDYAFAECASLSQVTLSSSLEVLGGGAFYNDDALASISILGNDAPTDFQVSWWADVIASDGAVSAAAQMCENAAFEAVCGEFGLGGPAASVLRELAVVYDVSALPESDE